MFNQAIEKINYSKELVEKAKNSVMVNMKYYEINNEDFTGVIVKIFDKGTLVKVLSNMDLDDMEKEVWSNQSDNFILPSVETAKEMFALGSDYTEVSIEVLEKWYT